MYFYHQVKTSGRLNPAQQILLERQGTMWEGSGKKELPEWMTRPEEADREQDASIHKHPLIRLGHLLSAVVGFSVKS